MKSTTKFFIALALGVFLFSYACKDYFGNYGQTPPKILLDYTELVDMLEHYDDTRKQPIKQLLGKEDTRINSFKLIDIKNYIAYIERECKAKNIPLDGINFISASYPDNYTRDPRKRNYQTLIMMPATEIAGEQMVSFDPFLSDDGKARPLKDILLDYKYTTWSYDTLATYKGSAKKTKSTKKTRSRSAAKSSGGGLSSGGNRASISPPY